MYQYDMSLAELGEISKGSPVGRALRKAKPHEREALMRSFAEDKTLHRGADKATQRAAVRRAREPLVQSGAVRPTRVDRPTVGERVESKVNQQVDRAAEKLVRPVTESVNTASRAATESTANLGRAAEKSTENVHHTVKETRGAVNDTSRNIRNIGIGTGVAGTGLGAAGLGYVGASRHFNSKQKKPPKQPAAINKAGEKKEKPEYRGGYVASPFTETQVRRKSNQRRFLRPAGGFLLGGGAGKLADVGLSAATKGRYKPKAMRGVNAKNIGALGGLSGGFSQNLRSGDIKATSRATGREADYKVTVPFPVAGRMNVYGYKPDRKAQ